MSQAMDGDALVDSGAQGGLAAGQLERGGAQVMVLSPGGKQIVPLGTDGAVFEAGDMVEERQYFFLAEHDGEFVGAAEPRKYTG